MHREESANIEILWEVLTWELWFLHHRMSAFPKTWRERCIFLQVRRLSTGNPKPRCQHERSHENCVSDHVLGSSVCTGPGRQRWRKRSWQEVRRGVFGGNGPWRAFNAVLSEDPSPATSDDLAFSVASLSSSLLLASRGLSTACDDPPVSCSAVMELGPRVTIWPSPFYGREEQSTLKQQILPTFTWISGDVPLVTEMLFALVGEACTATEIRLLADRLSKQASEVCLNSYLLSPLHSHWVSNRSYQGRRASLNPRSLETPKGSLFGWLLKFPQIWKPATRQCTWSSQHGIESFPAAIVVTEGR